MITGTQIAVTAGIIAAVAIICFMIGLFCRRNSDTELIAELDQELDARQAVINTLSRELRGRRHAVGELVHDDTTEVIPATAAAVVATRIQPGGQGYVQMPAWAADQELQLWVEAAGADLQRYVGALIARAERETAA